jgi:hypothetical protein
MAGKNRDQDSEVRLGRWDAEVGHAGRIIPTHPCRFKGAKGPKLVQRDLRAGISFSSVIELPGICH